MSDITTSSAVDTLLQAADAAGIRTAAGCPAGSGTSTGTNTGDQTSVTGNAGTATALASARNIDGQAFDGTANITVIAPGTHAASSKTTPVDADETALVDSAASNVLKKLTWANIKATLKTYFDTLYAAAGSGGGAVMQVKSTSLATYSSTTATIPLDDTIPQSTEGSQLLEVTLTPGNASNNLAFSVEVPCYSSGVGNVYFAIFQDSGSNALQATWQTTPTGTIQTLRFTGVFTAGTTSATVIKLRVGVSAGTLYFNGSDGGRFFGGTMKCTMTITESAP